MPQTYLTKNNLTSMKAKLEYLIVAGEKRVDYTEKLLYKTDDCFKKR